METGVSYAKRGTSGTGRFVRLRPILGATSFEMSPSLLHAGRGGIGFVSWDATGGAPPRETPAREDLPASERRSWAARV